MYQFQIRAYTQIGEAIAVVGSTEELGNWDVAKAIPLTTSKAEYPLWQTPQKISFAKTANINYKYLLLKPDGSVIWENWGNNRWLPADTDRVTVVDDGGFGYIQPYPFGYELNPASVNLNHPQNQTGLKIVIIGSSVAQGHKAWLMQGWAALLSDRLTKDYGHKVINVSEAGANVSRTIARFSQVVTPASPDIVITALSLGNEGFATCPPQQRRTIKRKFESGLQQLIKMTQAIGAMPILAGIYPHGEYESEHRQMLWETHRRMLNWGVPVLDWLAAIEDGQGRWQSGISFDPAHPNSLGHQKMYAAIAPQVPNIFAITKAQIQETIKRWQQQTDIYLDRNGFRIFIEDEQIRIINPSQYEYAIAPYWQELQTAFQSALQTQGQLILGIYLADPSENFPTTPYLYIQEDGSIDTTVKIPAHADLTYSSAFNHFTSAPSTTKILCQEGDLGIFKISDRYLWIINESEHQYNIQPMWQQVRTALMALPQGVYIDRFNPDTPFRTLMIGKDGLESRVKVPPKSALFFSYKCDLSDIKRVAILPLGDRCAVRMMLYKMEYDGPAFPFDLTRSTKISDVADAIATGFEDMWNPQYLHYNPAQNRIYHSKWQGLSFAHEVEADEDPVRDMTPIYKRMQTRYAARSKRFWYTLNHCDQVLFVRTGVCDRPGVIDLVEKLKTKCHINNRDKPFQLLLLSPQSSHEFAGLDHVLHYNVEFNPDQMYDNLDHWLYCTKIMHNILESLNISSKNLFWCPPYV
ncbi:lysophospholipase L1-like esterase [Synechococcus sp. PCC 7502]|uniref:DUF1796 family putative cysteine peptidase n=1 Tax=Synechococcus sp. PCC 7502 TaxID=1173263 RepID=UPI00029FFFD6|nr:DUF1796 family putative cysteine peptidase [Synechococcus sp. PCC 7502]AFY73047.1 lysophospholipase L1-like esterase [Synechococcus sp. PCC 7502]